MEGLLEARGLHGYAESHVLLSFLHFVFQLFEGEDESESISSHSCLLFPLIMIPLSHSPGVTFSVTHCSALLVAAHSIANCLPPV